MAAQGFPNFSCQGPHPFPPTPPHDLHILQHRPPILAFHPKAPQLMLFSVADMIQCGAVCNCLYRELTTIAGRVKPIIKSVIPIIHSHAALTSSGQDKRIRLFVVLVRRIPSGASRGTFGRRMKRSSLFRSWGTCDNVTHEWSIWIPSENHLRIKGI